MTEPSAKAMSELDRIRLAEQAEEEDDEDEAGTENP
jgi:hypothetical protein